MIDVIVHIGIIAIARARGHQRIGIRRNRQELQPGIVGLRTGFGDRPHRIFRQQRIGLHRRVKIALQLRDRQPCLGTTPAAFALIADAPIIGLVIPFEGDQRPGIGQNTTCCEQVVDIGPAAQQAPTEIHPGLAMQGEIGLDRRPPVRAHSFRTRANPAKPAMAQHLDRLFQVLSAIGQRSDNADRIEEIAGRDRLLRCDCSLIGLRRIGLRPCP